MARSFSGAEVGGRETALSGLTEVDRERVRRRERERLQGRLEEVLGYHYEEAGKGWSSQAAVRDPYPVPRGSG